MHAGRGADRRRSSFAGAPDAPCRAAALRRAAATRGAIIIGPSNPVISIGPILAIAGIRAAIAGSRGAGRRRQPDRRRRGAEGPDRGLPGVGGCERRRRGRRARTTASCSTRSSATSRSRASAHCSATRGWATPPAAGGSPRDTLELAASLWAADAHARDPPGQALRAGQDAARASSSRRRSAAGSRRRWSATCSTPAARRAGLEAVVVVTNEPAVAELASALGAIVLADPTESGQSAAALVGDRPRAAALGYERALLVPGDCPALDGDDAAGLLDRASRRPSVTIVADRHGTGTNALLLTPPDAIEPGFGPGQLRAPSPPRRRRPAPHGTSQRLEPAAARHRHARGPRRASRRAGGAPRRAPAPLLGGALMGAVSRVRARRACRRSPPATILRR